VYRKVIKNKTQYRRVMRRIKALMNGFLNSLAGEELELLCILAELWENQQFPLQHPDPIEAIQFRMDQAGLKNKDMIPYLGSLSKVSEVLNGKRNLSIGMIRRLHEGLGIPAVVLIRETS